MFDKLPETTQALLRERNFPADILDRAVVFPPEAGVLLVGSYAEGLAHPASDLDFLVLLEGDEAMRQEEQHAAVGHPSTIADEILLLANGVEVNFEAVRWPAITPLAQSAQHLALFSGSYDGPPSLPMLQVIEMRFLSRLRSGIPLRGLPRIAAWRERLHADLLPHYWATVNWVGAMDYLEDASSRLERPSDRLAGAIMARIAAEGLILSALAYGGVVLHDLKNASLHVTRMIARGDRLLPPLLDMEELLFPRPERFGREYFDLVFDQAARLYICYKEDGKMPTIVEFLRHYGQGRWVLDTSFVT